MHPNGAVKKELVVCKGHVASMQVLPGEETETAWTIEALGMRTWHGNGNRLPGSHWDVGPLLRLFL